MPIRLGLFVVFTAGLAAPVLAQEPTSTVTGIVVDSANQPMSGVLVFVDEGPNSATTGVIGAFRLEGVAMGTHRLHVRKAGFAPRTFNLVFAPNEDGRDVGVVMLEEGPDPTATLSGRVTDGPSGRPLLNAVVQLNDEIVAVTDSTGAFSVSDLPIPWGPNEIQVGGISYADATNELWMVDPNETFDFSVRLDPAPIELDGVVASIDQADRVILLFDRRMRPFYERREKGLGRFLTRLDIEERNPVEMTDLLRGVPGVRLRPSGTFSYQILFRRGCSPLIFLDGVLVRRGTDIDNLVNPHQVEGIEVYTSGVEVPVQYNLMGGACGAIVIWTR